MIARWQSFLLMSLLMATALAQDSSTAPDHEGEDEPVAETVKDVFTADERAAMDAGAEKHVFNAEVNRLMEILIHSLYTDRDIFLRELISNAGDALDKIRFLSLTDKAELSANSDELAIYIKADPATKTISVRDTGVGMTKQDLEQHLGSLGASGTSKFSEMVEGAKDVNLIGQFGVGFYSTFLVADEVEVISKNNADDTQWVWRSAADGTFSMVADPRGNTLGRGTEVILHMREDAETYVNEQELEKIAKRYSEFMTFPIRLWTTRTESKEVPVEDVSNDDDEDETADKDAEDGVEVEDEDDEDAAEKPPKTKTVTETIEEWKRLNENAPIWTRSKNDIEDAEYASFYKSFSKDYAEPLTWTHNKAEGDIEFKSLLYIPTRAPHDLYDKYYQKSSSLALYVRRVLINDNFEDFMPRYLNFIKGLVDSNDLPLNVNREQLQKSKLLKTIGKKLTQNVLKLLRKLAEEDNADDEDEDTEEAAEDDDDEEAKAKKAAKKDEEPKYTTFWNQFGKSIKLGVIEDTKNRKKLAKLLRFTSSKSDGKIISLEEYVDRMPEEQKVIYFIAGASQEAVENSVFLGKFLARGVEVLYMVDPLDEYVTQHMTEYESHKLQSITKEGVDLDDASSGRKKQMEAWDAEFEPLKKFFESTFEGQLENVKVSSILKDAPVAITTGQYGWSANMERIAQAQAFQSGNQASYMGSKKTLQINPRHPLIKALNAKVQQEDADASAALKNEASLLFDLALIDSGFSIQKPQDFTARLQSVLRSALQVDVDAAVDAEIEYEDDDEEEEEEEEDEAEAESADDGEDATAEDDAPKDEL